MTEIKEVLNCSVPTFFLTPCHTARLIHNENVVLIQRLTGGRDRGCGGGSLADGTTRRDERFKGLGESVVPRTPPFSFTWILRRIDILFKWRLPHTTKDEVCRENKCAETANV